MALPQSVALSCFVVFLVIVLQLNAAPLESTTQVSPQTELPEITVKSNNASTTPSSISSSSKAVILTSSSPTSLMSTESTRSSSVSEILSTDETFSPVPTTQSPFSSDEAIRHMPGYWIKRPSMSSSSNGSTNTGDEVEEHPGEAQESFIDYRTERYQIEDLFPAHTIAQEEQINITAKSQEEATPLQEGPV